MSAHASDAGKDLPGDEEGEQIVKRGAEEVFVLHLYEIILVAAERMTTVMVHRVVMERGMFRQPQIIEKTLDNPLSGFIVLTGVEDVGAFGSGILLMITDGIDIKPPAVQKKTAAASGLEGIISGMQIDQPPLLLIEAVVLDLLNDPLRRSRLIIPNKAPELGLYTEDALFHV
jgi:hypothetical protein